MALSILVIAGLAYLVSRLTIRLVIPFLLRAAALSKTGWDDLLVRSRFFDHLSLLIPVVVYATVGVDDRAGHPLSAEVVRRLCMTILVFLAVRMIDSILYTVEQIYKLSEVVKRKPIGGYLSVVRIVMFVLPGIFIISTLANKSPWGIFSVLGGLTAVVLLIFKDTILGFVASLQLASNDMVRVGDWIEMPSFEADGVFWSGILRPPPRGLPWKSMCSAATRSGPISKISRPIFLTTFWRWFRNLVCGFFRNPRVWTSRR